jgi:hypothetical protein
MASTLKIREQVKKRQEKKETLIDEMAKPQENINTVQVDSAIKRAKTEVEHLVKQLDGKNIPASTARNIRKQLDDMVNWSRDAHSEAVEVLMENLHKKFRTTFKNSLEASASSTGNGSYLESMRKLNRGFEVVDNLRESGMPKTKRNIESWVSRYEGKNSVNKHKALQLFDEFYGTNYAQKMKAIAKGHQLGIDDLTGAPSNVNLLTTGKSRSALGKLGPKRAGELIKPIETLTDALATPNLGAILTGNAPSLPEVRGNTPTNKTLNFGTDLLMGGPLRKFYEE